MAKKKTTTKAKKTNWYDVKKRQLDDMTAYATSLEEKQGQFIRTLMDIAQADNMKTLKQLKKLAGDKVIEFVSGYNPTKSSRKTRHIHQGE